MPATSHKSMLSKQRTLQRDVNGEQAIRGTRLPLVSHAHQAQHPRHVAEQVRDMRLGAHTHIVREVRV